MKNAQFGTIALLIVGVCIPACSSKDPPPYAESTGGSGGSAGNGGSAGGSAGAAGIGGSGGGSAGSAGSGGAAGTGGNAGAAGASGTGGTGPACTTGLDCPGVDSDCETRTCKVGICGKDFAADGSAVTIQTAGDCKTVVCDGAGKEKTINTNTDLPNDGKQCTEDVCTAGVPSNTSKAEGTTCTENSGKVCNATGACVECTSGSRKCNGTTVQTCQGGKWENGNTCVDFSPLCQAGECICVDGKKRCNSFGWPEVCNLGIWTSSVACGNTYQCVEGDCVCVNQCNIVGSWKEVAGGGAGLAQSIAGDNTHPVFINGEGGHANGTWLDCKRISIPDWGKVIVAVSDNCQTLTFDNGSVWQRP